MSASVPKRVVSLAVPAGTIALTLGLWEAAVRWWNVPPYILPGPVRIGQALAADWGLLSGALGATLETTLLALAAAVAAGTVLAFLMTLSRWLELAFVPFMVAMQVTPIIAIAPLIILWVSNLKLGLLICAWLVAFFPIVSNTMAGLKSTDHSLEDLFDLYAASPWQRFWRLRAPTALPYFLAGLRISGGLALIGAIAAEFVAGSGGQGAGLAFQIMQAGYQENIPRMFAGLFLISGTGLMIYLVLTGISHLALRKWHESARGRDQ
jgi:NitT/TauT family transport system permease protein